MSNPFMSDAKSPFLVDDADLQNLFNEIGDEMTVKYQSIIEQEKRKNAKLKEEIESYKQQILKSKETEKEHFEQLQSINQLVNDQMTKHNETLERLAQEQMKSSQLENLEMLWKELRECILNTTCNELNFIRSVMGHRGKIPKEHGEPPNLQWPQKVQYLKQWFEDKAKLKMSHLEAIKRHNELENRLEKQMMEVKGHCQQIELSEKKNFQTMRTDFNQMMTHIQQEHGYKNMHDVLNGRYENLKREYMKQTEELDTLKDKLKRQVLNYKQKLMEYEIEKSHISPVPEIILPKEVNTQEQSMANQSLNIQLKLQENIIKQLNEKLGAFVKERDQSVHNANQTQFQYYEIISRNKQLEVALQDEAENHKKTKDVIKELQKESQENSKTLTYEIGELKKTLEAMSREKQQFLSKEYQVKIAMNQINEQCQKVVNEKHDLSNKQKTAEFNLIQMKDAIEKHNVQRENLINYKKQLIKCLKDVLIFMRNILSNGSIRDFSTKERLRNIFCQIQNVLGDDHINAATIPLPFMQESFEYPTIQNVNPTFSTIPSFASQFNQMTNNQSPLHNMGKNIINNLQTAPNPLINPTTPPSFHYLSPTSPLIPQSPFLKPKNQTLPNIFSPTGEDAVSKVINDCFNMLSQ